jgi:hypothetical protein
MILPTVHLIEAVKKAVVIGSLWIGRTAQERDVSFKSESFFKNRAMHALY